MNKIEIPLGLYNPNVTIFKDLLKPNSESSVVPLNEVINRIRNGSSKDLINKVRSGNKELKTKLPCICFSGEFLSRNADGLKNHSGLMVLDFDKINSEDLKETQNKINTNKHIRASFISPSGNGIKALVRVPNDLNKLTHAQHYQAFREEFKFDYLDSSGSDVARVCFESYDQNVYENQKAKTYKPKLKELKLCSVTNVAKTSPEVIISASENDVIEGIMKFNFKTSFASGQLNQYVFSLAGTMCEYGVAQAAAEGYIMANIVEGNCKKPQAKLNTIRSAYKSREFGSKTYEDLKKRSSVIKQITKGVPLTEIAAENKISIEDIAKIEKEEQIFWYVSKNKVHINEVKFASFLVDSGFYSYLPSGAKSPILVRVKKNVVTETSAYLITKFIKEFIKNNQELHRTFISYIALSTERFFTSHLDQIEFETLRDTREKAFIPYQNGILEITNNSKTLVPYSNTTSYIWEEQIIKRDYVEHQDNTNDYKKFVSNVSNSKPEAIESVLGYLISTYKNRSNNKAIILNDEVISDVAEGGTGKGLLMQGIEQIRNTSILDGKSFDDKKTFKYQTVSRDTQVLVFDDVKKSFNLESKYSIITEGLEIERKNKDAIRLSVKESPKIVISTNYVIQGDGNSHHRRVHEVEISQYYGKHLTPEDEFNRQLFQDWDSIDFEKFDNYMIYCLQKYMIHGLINQQPKNLKLRKLIGATNKDFVDFMEEGNIVVGERIQTELAFNNFKDECKDFDNKHFSRKRFSIWLSKYCDYKGFEFNSLNSGGMRYIYLVKKDEIKEDNVKTEEINF